ncbi:MBL fold metallo-hydrolase [Halpernia frigidisoli]|uniref:Glyoxylase, beta-lactamase superfamily II n=1 Tax=Halpernia frigidisoli TaxID=1125876 RepID=A0A1I3G101_9FLAO|nr:MBL fold metallo-hydrolase [Halpernia frigidisoli]SFI17165.1 Glyoxylase, beta-lactamase superfamily II [Halpernia frigidisoli]
MLQIKSFTFNPFSENTYVVYNEFNNAYIIDPGNFTDEENNILKHFIKDNDLKVEHILLTHAHIDHVLGVQWAFDEYQVPVMLHEIEREILDRNPIDAMRFGFQFKAFVGEILYLKEDDVLNLNEDELKVLHLPGHSPGHIAFYNEAQKLIISGDVLFEGSIGRTDLYKGDHAQLLESIRMKMFNLHAETQVFNGHGNPTSIGFERDFNTFFK